MGPGMMGPGMGPQLGYGLGQLSGYGAVVLGAIAEALGMAPADLSARLQAGATLSELAQEQDVSPDEVISSALDAVSRLVDRQVSQGQLSQMQGELILAQIESQLRAQLDLPGVWGLLGQGFTGMYHSPMLIQASRSLDLSLTELVSRLQMGATVADLAAEQGVDLEQDIIEPLLEPERARLQVMLDMDFIAQPQADAELAVARNRLLCQAYMVGGVFGYGMGMGMGYGPGMGGMGGWPWGMMGCPYCGWW